jgi:GNAT superfamily N-acetyltransferase
VSRVAQNHVVDITVRRVRPEEWRELKSVRLAALADSPSAFGSTHAREAAFDDAEWIDRAERGSRGVDRVTFVAIDHDGRGFVGIAGGFCYPEDSTHRDLVSMWTSPAARRAGVGRRLVASVLDWAGVDTEVHLWVTEGNDPAQRLYETMGFEVTDDVQPHPNDPCANEIRMVRRAGSA